MKEHMYTVKAFAKLTGVTERTLHFYDRKGLLAPSSYNEHGHRLYSKDDIFTMQKIITLKYLGFSLQEILDYLANHDSHQIRDTLQKQKVMLEKKREELDYVINTITRVERIMQDEELDSDLLLAIIHSIHHEKKQEEWLSARLPKSVIEHVLLQHLSPQERLEFEREMLTIVNQLQHYCKQGILPSEEEVQRVIEHMISSMNERIAPHYQQKIAEIDLNDHPQINVSIFSKEVEEYIKEAVNRFEANQLSLSHAENRV